MCRQFWATLIIALLTLASGAVLAAAPTITAFNPTTGPLYTSVVITGTGFTGSSAVTFDGTAASFTVNSSTQITALVPATGTGTIAVTNAGATGTSGSAFTVTPGVSFSPSIGHESIAVTVIGSGFAPYNSIDLYFDTTDEALVVSNSLGVASITFQVPATAQPGTHYITLNTRTTGIAAQHAFTVNSNWAMQGATPTGLGFNAYENTLSNANVSQLSAAWTEPDGGFANPTPIIEQGGTIFTGTVLGQIYAYSAAGTLLWHAQPAGDFQYTAPAANSSLVFFGSGTSVYAYKVACSTAGAACTPTWTAKIGADVASGGLTIYNNMLYVPGSDGNIYPITPSTGAVGTPFAAAGSSGPATSQIAFALDGGYYYAEGSSLAYMTAGGGSSTVAASGTVSAPVVSAGRVYFTTSAGMIYRFRGWSAATSGTGCNPAPVVSGHFVYAGGCTSIAAFEAGNGTEEWNITTGGRVLGLSVANGVLYGCVENGGPGELVAYDAGYGGFLWSGGTCTGAPVIANGSVYAALGEVTSYTLPGFSPTYKRLKPAPFTLRPNWKLWPQRTPEAVAGH